MITHHRQTYASHVDFDSFIVIIIIIIVINTVFMHLFRS